MPLPRDLEPCPLCSCWAWPCNLPMNHRCKRQCEISGLRTPAGSRVSNFSLAVLPFAIWRADSGWLLVQADEKLVEQTQTQPKLQPIAWNPESSLAKVHQTHRPLSKFGGTLGMQHCHRNTWAIHSTTQPHIRHIWSSTSKGWIHGIWLEFIYDLPKIA